MGTYGPGEISALCGWALPNVAIVTNVGVSHLERMQTPDRVAEAKSELPRALPATGLAILNYDDARVLAMASLTRARTLTYGLDPRADIWADAVTGLGLDGIQFRVHAAGEAHLLRMPLVGRHNVYTALPAIALGRELGLTWADIAAGLSDPHLQQRVVAVPGVNGSTIIDDTYNAAPVSCKAALNLLADLPGRHLVAFGEMAELGPIEEQGHREVGVAAAHKTDLLVVIGTKARWIGVAAQECRPDLPVIFVSSNDAAATALRGMLQPGDVLLVKGARVAATEEIVRALAVET
ncbi:MAG: hypothetical protein NVS4B8_12770 [Herpetosiphon sp.]